MSLSDFVNKLQNQPRHIRVMILWLSVGACMLALFIFWVNTLDLGLSTPAGQPEQALGGEGSLSDIKEEIPSLWQSLKAGVGSLLETINKETKKEESVQVEQGSQQQEEVLPAQLPQ